MVNRMTNLSLEPEEFSAQAFDYLVIGGGTAGLVVATRLSENPHLVIGVLEAGPPAYDTPEIDVPGRFGETLGTEFDWKFETTPQPGFGGRTLPWPRGKVLGGTSALNFMAWTRGNREDYNAWEELGNEGWGWEKLLPHFKKSESFEEPDIAIRTENGLAFQPEFHGTTGPIKTIYPNYYSETHKYWHSTLNRLGIKSSEDQLSGSNVGVWTSLGSVDPKTRTRSYAANAYLLPNIHRKNLHVLTEATVRDIDIENEGGEFVAKGVRFLYQGKELHVKCSKEVILSAGSVQSPQLLELSGIGNPDILKAAGIEIKVENTNVGENLQEHMMTMMVYELDSSVVTPEDLRSDPVLAEKADELYVSTQSGIRTALCCSMSYLPLSTFIPASTLETYASKATRTGKDVLGESILKRQFSADSNLGQMEFIFDTSNYSSHYTSAPTKKYGTLLQILQYPFSRGSIHIPATKNGSQTTSDQNPIIDPQYYRGEGGKVDFEIMAAAQSYAEKICTTEPLSNIITARVFPPPVVAGEDEDFTSFVRDFTVTDWHPVGTCAMGGYTGIKTGVVDSRLRVYGVRGLRVIDASIMPLHVSAHIQATIYAIAEKGASMILEDVEGK